MVQYSEVSRWSPLLCLTCRAGANVTCPCSNQGRIFATPQPIVGTRPSDLLLILKLVFIPLLASQFPLGPGNLCPPAHWPPSSGDAPRGLRECGDPGEQRFMLQGPFRTRPCLLEEIRLLQGPLYSLCTVTPIPAAAGDARPWDRFHLLGAQAEGTRGLGTSFIFSGAG